MVAVTACGIAALGIAIGADLPQVHDTGQVGELYTDASAGPKTGYYLELAGGALLTLAGGALLAAQVGASRERSRRRRGDHAPATSGSQ
jgi:hypothetical protein